MNVLKKSIYNEIYKRALTIIEFFFSICFKSVIQEKNHASTYISTHQIEDISKKVDNLVLLFTKNVCYRKMS